MSDLFPKNQIYEVQMHVKGDPTNVIVIGQATMEQSAMVIELMDEYWTHIEEHGCSKKLQPIFEKWEGCEIMAVDLNTRLIVGHYTDHWNPVTNL